jgi:hypothetical protein
VLCCETPHPEGDRKGPHSAPRHTPLTKTTQRDLAVPFLCKGGGSEDEGMGPLRSPWGVGLLHLTLITLSSFNRRVEPDTRKGFPNISHGHMKLNLTPIRRALAAALGVGRSPLHSPIPLRARFSPNQIQLAIAAQYAS